MTRIVLEPYEKVVVRSCFEYKDVSSFVEALSIGTPPGRYPGLLWANRVLFRYSPLFPTDSVTMEYIKGNLLIDSLEFTRMESHEKELTPKERGVVLTVADVSGHALFDQLTKWINVNYLNRAKRHRR